MTCCAYHKEDIRSGILVGQYPVHFQTQDNTWMPGSVGLSYDNNAQGRRMHLQVIDCFSVHGEVYPLYSGSMEWRPENGLA